MNAHNRLGFSGRVAARFQNNAITPLLALLGLLLGFFAIAITPKEEEPQIDVTFANVFIGFPGASAKEVENLISIPAEQVLSELKGVDDIYSVSKPGMSIITVAFEVGLERESAILNLYNKVYSHNDWLPANLGAMQPLIKPKGIDDVPIMAITLWSSDKQKTQQDLTSVAHTLELELKRVEGTRDIYTLGNHNQIVSVQLDPIKLNAYGMSVTDVRNALISSNTSSEPIDQINNNQIVQIQIGEFMSSVSEIQNLIIGMSGNDSSSSPVYLNDVASIMLQADTPEQQVYYRKQQAPTSHPAVTLAIAKKPGTNAIEITQKIEDRLQKLKGISLPDDINVELTRDYGKTAKEKSDQLISKLLFATAAVVLLVLITMSWREAIIVGGAIFITLAITLFASWAWGFTLNRVSLFALIFSIGILVDDAIVVVENIHRHIQKAARDGKQSLIEIIPKAVDEVGGPTILATFTVIAALMPMAFVSGLMGPYMSPIPINASTGMLISLIIAFVVTPWLSFKLLNAHADNYQEDSSEPETSSGDADLQSQSQSQFYRIIFSFMEPFVVGQQARRNRYALMFAILILIGFSMMLPVMKSVVLKMLPFDNKSEFQVMVDMPEGTPMENTLLVLEQLGDYLTQVEEVDNIQLYAGTSAPINFNGLVRQYYLRNQPNMGDIQVNLKHKSKRSRQSHDIALAVRKPLQMIGHKYDANIKVVEAPPGPPVMSPIVAEVYGANYQQQIETAKRIRNQFMRTVDIIDVDDSVESSQSQFRIHIDRQKAARNQVSYQQIVTILTTALNGEDVSYLHSQSQKYALPIRLQYSNGTKADLQTVLQSQVRSANGKLIPISEFVKIHEGVIEKTIYHKNLLPVVFVTGDMAGDLDSPLYGLFDMSVQLTESDPKLDQHFIQQPDISFKPSIKWDGEWQITYETFRDMGIAYAVGMILIYLLVVAQFKSYLVPLIIMAPIPLTVMGVMPGHAILNAQFTATSMIGMIALAGIIVRNSILLVDFINQEISRGVALNDAVIRSTAIRAKPIMLTAVAAMMGAFFILDDPIFNGLAISLIFGIMVSTILTLIVIPLLYFSYLRRTA